MTLNTDILNIIGEYVFDSDFLSSTCLCFNESYSDDEEYNVCVEESNCGIPCKNDSGLCPCEQCKPKTETCSECKTSAKIFYYNVTGCSRDISYQMCYTHTLYNIYSGGCKKCGEFGIDNCAYDPDLKCYQCKKKYCKNCVYVRPWNNVLGFDRSRVDPFIQTQNWIEQNEHNFTDYYGNSYTEPLCNDCWKNDLKNIDKSVH